MKSDGCRSWRESLGAHALGQLPEDERAGLEAHLEGCPECRAELEALAPVARMLPLADPERFSAAPQPPPELAGRITAMIREESRSRRRRRRLRFSLGLGGATAAVAAAVLAIFILPGGGPSLEQRVRFESLPPGKKISATLQPHPFGTEIHMYVGGFRTGVLCRVSVRGPDGVQLPAGTFRYRSEVHDVAILSSALDISRTRALVVRVGRRTFVAPVRREGAA
jgi:hypothetical protein